MMRRAFALPGYTIHVAPGALAEAGRIVRQAAPAHRIVVVTDHTVRALHGPGAVAALQDDSGAALVSVLEIPPGEGQKTRERWSALTDEMLALGCGRDTTVVALGGGVIGDLAGFVAATFLRGVPVVQVPTTLLAMVDASVGGKTGVDTAAGKNLVGAFHAPSAVIADPIVLATLERAHLRAGLAEVLKHGVIADAGYLDEIVRVAPAVLGDPASALATLCAIVTRSVEIKAAVVARDAFERGERRTLNFGHTLGHAIEHESGYTLLHGEAVAIGMALESRLAESLGVAAPGTADAVHAALAAAALPSRLPDTLDPARIVAATHADKKSRRGVVEYALPLRVGAMAGADRGWSLPVEDDEVLAMLR